MLQKGMTMLCAFGIFLTWIGLCTAGETADHICFRKIDQDQNGKVTMEEFAEHYGNDESKFKKADSDDDGLLTHDEYHDLIGRHTK